MIDSAAKYHVWLFINGKQVGDNHTFADWYADDAAAAEDARAFFTGEGDTAKHIKLAFAQARENDAVLFFDEADSLLSKRVSTGESYSTSINQNRNTLMQELDRFDGVVIVTTTLFEMRP